MYIYIYLEKRDKKQLFFLCIVHGGGSKPVGAPPNDTQIISIVGDALIKSSQS